MSIIEFLSKLRKLDIKLWLENDTLRYQAPKGAATKELLLEIKDRKDEIISFLRQVNIEAHINRKPITRASKENGQALPLSFSQQSMWLHNQITKANPVFNISNAVKMTGTLRKDILIQSLKEVISRHEALRTTFRSVDGSPVQIIKTSVEVTLAEMDLRNIPQKEQEQYLEKSLKEEARFIFDLEKGPLFRFRLFIMGENEYVFSMVIHHIISDAWSNAIFVGELFRFYEAFLNEEDLKLPELPIQYSDYSVWERNWLQGEELEELLGYWRKQLAKPTTIQLPTDYPRPKSQTYEGGFEPIFMEKALTERLKAICNKEGTTLFMIILAAFQTLLYRYSNQTDILTGTVVANRNRKEVKNLVGFFMNTLVLRSDFEGNPSFIEVLRKIKNMALDAYTYQELPFDKLLEELRPERDASRTPLFQTMLIFHNTQKVELELSGLKMNQIEVESGMAPFDLRLQLAEADGGIKGGFDYDSALFKNSTIKRFGVHLLNILEAISVTPVEKVSDIVLTTKEEQNQILMEFNNTNADFPRDKVIHEFFEGNVAKHPEQIAAIYENQHLTYLELNERANQLARLLRSNGVKSDSIIGIMLERSLEMIIGIMAVEKAGGAYLPIDPHYPKDRINYILEDSGVTLLLSYRKFGSIEVNEKIHKIFLDDASLYEGDSSNLPRLAEPENLAYVIYTSGSTGKPKGTLIEHHSLVNRLNWMQKRYPIGPEDIILQKTPFTFDVSLWEMFWWSMQGAKVCFLEPDAEKNPEMLVNAIEKNCITVLHFVPSMLNSFLKYINETGEIDRIASLKQVFASGEALTPYQVRLFKRLLEKNGTQLANLYGPTEATVDVSYFDCNTTEDLDCIPIGKPIDNIKLYIMDNKMQLQPIGVAGELCIAGEGLARGYQNCPDLTDEKFVQNTMEPERKMYRTGDLARWREDGNIEYLGRIDFQVKIRGFRIELGEIESQLLKFEYINEAIVVDKEDANGGGKYLCAYFVSDRELTVAQLKEHILKELPTYMVPSYFIRLEKMPLTENGKIDRRKLPEPDASYINTGVEFITPRNKDDESMAKIWCDILGLDKVSIEDNFFNLGGDSIKAMDMVARAAKAGMNLSVSDIFSYTTIKGIMDALKADGQMKSFYQLEEIQEKYSPKDYQEQMDGKGLDMQLSAETEVSLAPNEEIDRKKLYESDTSSINTEVEFIPTRKEKEESMAKIWCDVLGLDKVSIEDNFFNLGGDSIKAMDVVARAAEVGIYLSVSDIFRYITIKDIMNTQKISEQQETFTQLEEVHDSVKNYQVQVDFNEVAMALSEEVEDYPVSKELKVVMQRDITTYLHRSLPLCAILAYDKYLPWYFSNFIQIFSHTDFNGYVEINYLEARDCYIEIAEVVCLGYHLLKNEKSILEFIIEKLNMGYYLVINVDEFYLSNKWVYQNNHFVHSSLIYGYDNTTKQVKAIGFNQERLFTELTFDYSEFNDAYENGKIYYKNDAPWCDWSAVQLIRPKSFEGEFPFIINRFINELEEYLFSRSDLRRLYSFEYQTEQVEYGFKTYDVLIKNLHNLLAGKPTIDYRAIHLLYEHKKCLYERLEYVITEYKLSGEIIELHKQYMEIVESWNEIRIEFLAQCFAEFDIKKLSQEQKSMLYNVINKVNKVKETEYEVLQRVIEQLKLNFT